MDVLSRHYHQLAGLKSDWAISQVQLDVQSQTLTLSLEFVGTRVVCPECGAECSMKDHAAERRWRHLDAMQFQTTLTARVPRCSCDRCGVKTISVPWADKHSRFTLLFQAFAIDVLPAAQSIQAAAVLLRIVPKARIVHDRFHIAKTLNAAVDKVRRIEHLLLSNPENLSEEKNQKLAAL